MQHETRWRRGRSVAWQVVLAGWLLVLTAVMILIPTDTGPDTVSRVLHHVQDEQVVAHAAEEAEPSPQPAAFEGGEIGVTEAEQPGAVDSDREGAPADGEQAPGHDPPVPDEAAPGDEAPPPEASDDVMEGCPAELGREKAASFGRDDRLVMTYYYYWYDEASLEDPALAQRPPPDPPLDWQSVNWHERQLADMASAGIDVALAVYWGDTEPWSVEALGPMVEARERLLAAGIRAPAIGLFFDTNMYALILPERPELADLTTDDGLDMLAYQIGVYLDRVPPCHRARVDGRPLAFFWRADTEDGDEFTFDDDTFSNLVNVIAAEHGEQLHLAVERSWQEAAHAVGVELGAMDVYHWGAALNGPRFDERTVAVGPGYDDTRIDGRPGYTRERVDGGTYRHDLRQAVMSGTPWLLLETWNELWEGTAIAETEETGRTYLGITATYTALFHQLGAEGARDAWFDLGTGQNAYLRRRADAPIEQGTPADVGGKSGARPLREEVDGTGYFHFAIDRRLGLDGPQPLTVLVEYFDEGDGSFTLEYDSLDAEAPDDGVYKATETVPFENTQTWRTHRFELTDASLRQRQYNGDGDFRIHDTPGEDGQLHAFGRVLVTAEPASRPVLYEPESLSFVDPDRDHSVTLRWADAGPVAGHQIVVQSFYAEDGADQYRFTTADGQRCISPVPGDRGQEGWERPGQTTCVLPLGLHLDEGVYRWRVHALDAAGNLIGEFSDWGYFVVARR